MSIAASRPLHAADVIDKQTMRTFDDLCLTPLEPLTPAQITAMGLRENASQARFARYLNVAPSTVSRWEGGEKRRSEASLELLALVDTKGLWSIA